MKKNIVVIIVAMTIIAITGFACTANTDGEQSMQQDTAVSEENTDEGQDAETTAEEVGETTTEENTDEAVTEENTNETADEASVEIPVADTAAGEYFVNALLKNLDSDNNIITVEQLMNDPDETEIDPEVVLAPEYMVVKSIYNADTGEEEQVIAISLTDIPLDSEVGIIFNADNTARAIIYQELAEE